MDTPKLALFLLLVLPALGDFAPCGYCSFCDECQHCEQCPCPEPDFAPNCDMCKYCKFCTLCKLCNTFCEDDGALASVSSSLSSVFSAATKFASSSLGLDLESSLLDGLDQDQVMKDAEIFVRGVFSRSPAVLDLGADTFAGYIAENPAVMVAFYAPWCGHCKAMKPAFTSAAEKSKDAAFAAVDCTMHDELCQEYGVEGFPSFIFFKDGQAHSNAYEHGRTEQAFMDYVADPDMAVPPPPPPPPPAEPTPFLEEGDGGVVMLTGETFQAFVESKEAVMVAFYAPWCGHCKSMKPAYSEAALEVPGRFGAVDCTVHGDVCRELWVRGYPNLKTFVAGTPTTFEGERTKDAFLAALHNAASAAEEGNAKTEL